MPKAMTIAEAVKRARRVLAAQDGVDVEIYREVLEVLLAAVEAREQAAGK